MKKWIALLILLILGACDYDSSLRYYPAETVSDESHQGLVRVLAEKSFVVLGAKGGNFRYNEQPRMTVRFDYNFSIGKMEVTNGEFRQYVSEEWGGFARNEDEKLPVVDVTYFDAVLYANARSKAEGFDTAYTYNQRTVDEDGHCNRMEGVTFLPDVDAYRLPTEAEWMLAATQDWNLDKAWTLENSDGRVHPGCSAGENLVGLCDMAGNVMEWVNDWMGVYTDTVVYNFAGAPDGGMTGERVLKGGSFRTARNGTNYVSRGDVYTVTSSTRANYVGFRIAFGKIPEASWFNGSGSVNNGRAVPQLSGSTIRSKMGTIQTKLAFRNDVSGNIMFIDYAITANTIFEIRDTLNCYHPDISPDGAFVAFSTGMEGPDMESSVYVRVLNIAGDSLVKLDVKNASVPRWRVDGFDTSIIYVTDAGNNKDGSSFHTKSTWQVPYKNFKFGEPKKLFDGAYHGGLSYDKRLAVTGNRLLRSRMADSASNQTVMDESAMDSVWYGGEQACNVSLAQDSTKRILFLDFGGKTGQEFVGSPYQVHERLLITDSLGNLIQTVAAPDGYAFDHSEWATGGVTPLQFFKRDFAVATLTNNNGSHEKIVLVDLRDSSITNLVEGTELWHPCLWTYTASVPRGGEFDKVDLDSAALYFENNGDPLIATKLNLFWAKGSYAKVIGLGSSRMSLGFIPNKMTYGAGLNMAVIPSDMDVTYYLAKNYVFNHTPKLRYLVVGLDMDLWSEKKGQNVSKNIKGNPGILYDISHNFWVDSNTKVLTDLSKIYLSQHNGLHRFSQRMGWVEETEKHSWSKGGFGNGFLENDSNWSNKSATYEYSMEELQEIVDMAKERNVTVVGVIFPQSPDYRKTGAFGRHGMRRSHAEKLIERFKEMEKDNSNFFLLDENKMGNHDYPDSTAFDFDHLNMYGGEILTSRIDSTIQAIEGKK